jgi:biotin transport system substrate-specific component
MFAVSPRLLRVPPYERGITLGDFFVPVRVGERASSRQRNLALVLLGVALIAASAQFVIRVPGSDVPVTGQTFGVLVTATALGLRRGIGSVGLYLLLGLALPIYAGGAHGLVHFVSRDGGHLVLGATGGYLLGFLLAGALVGRLAELGWDRHLGGSLAAMILGNIVIYAVGVAWLAVALDLTAPQAISAGLTPFLAGDALKILFAALVFPLGWWVVGRRPSDR